MSNRTGDSRNLPMTAGLLWFKSAVLAVRSNFPAIVGVSLFYIFTMGLLSVLPMAGNILAALFMPFGSVMLAKTTQDALNGNPPDFGIIKKLWSNMKTRNALLRLGLVFGFLLITVNALYGFLSADDVAMWKETADHRLDWNSVKDNIPWTAFAVMLFIYIPGLMCTWFSPLLIAYRDMECGKSLFYSFFGCTRNIMPILFLGVIIIAASSIVMGAGIALVVLLNLTSLSTFILAPLLCLVTSVVYATYWPMYEALFDGVK